MAAQPNFEYENPASVSAPCALRYDSGGPVGDLHRVLERQLSANRVILAMPPASFADRAIEHVSRLMGPALLIAGLCWTILKLL